MLGFVPVGNTWGSSVQCNMMRGNVTAYGMLDYGYDEAYSLSNIWKHASVALGGGGPNRTRQQLALTK